MNDRDFYYIEERLYGNGAAAEALVRLDALGEDELVTRLANAIRDHNDALHEVRMALLARRNPPYIAPPMRTSDA